MSRDSVITKMTSYKQNLQTMQTASSESVKQFHLYWNLIKIMFALYSSHPFCVIFVVVIH